MNAAMIESLPSKILTLGAAFISGFILSAWCLPSINNKPRIESTRPGAFLVIPAKDFLSPKQISELKGKSVRLIRKSGSEKDEACVINHKPAQVQLNDQNVYLEFGLDGLESLVLNVFPSDLKLPDMIENSKSDSLKSCSSHPRITYGS